MTNHHVLIIRAGIVGLTIAQGCRLNGIPFTIFERDETGRAQGWALTLHWCMEAFERTIGSELTSKLHTTLVDASVKHDERNVSFFNAATGEVRFKYPITKRRIRVQRQKIRDLLSTRIDIQEGRYFQSVEELSEGGLRVNFKDCSSATGTMMVGADGANSMVRKVLLGEQSTLTPFPIELIALVRHFTVEQGEPVRALDPLLFQSLDPNTGNFLFFGAQEAIEETPGRYAFDALISTSWIVKDETENAIPSTNYDKSKR